MVLVVVMIMVVVVVMVMVMIMVVVMFMVMFMLMIVIVVMMIKVMIFISFVSAKSWTGDKSCNSLFVSFCSRFYMATVLVLLVSVGNEDKFFAMFFVLALMLAILSTVGSFAVVDRVR